MRTVLNLSKFAFTLPLLFELYYFLLIGAQDSVIFLGLFLTWLFNGADFNQLGSHIEHGLLVVSVLEAKGYRRLHVELGDPLVLGRLFSLFGDFPTLSIVLLHDGGDQLVERGHALDQDEALASSLRFLDGQEVGLGHITHVYDTHVILVDALDAALHYGLEVRTE